MCISPQLIAAYHVLHRLSEPRHPPCALSCFKKFRTSFSGTKTCAKLIVVCCYPTTKTSDQPMLLGCSSIFCDRYFRLFRLTTFQLIPICQRTIADCQGFYLIAQINAPTLRCRCSGYEPVDQHMFVLSSSNV